MYSFWGEKPLEYGDQSDSEITVINGISRFGVILSPDKNPPQSPAMEVVEHFRPKAGLIAAIPPNELTSTHGSMNKEKSRSEQKIDAGQSTNRRAREWHLTDFWGQLSQEKY